MNADLNGYLSSNEWKKDIMKNRILSVVAMGMIALLGNGCAQEASGAEQPNVEQSNAGRPSISAPDGVLPFEADLAEGQVPEGHVEIAPGVFLLDEVAAAGQIRFDAERVSEVPRARATAGECNGIDSELREGESLGGYKWKTYAFGIEQAGGGGVWFFGDVTGESGAPGVLVGGAIYANGQYVGQLSGFSNTSTGPVTAQGSWFVPCVGGQATFEIDSGFLLANPGGTPVLEQDNVDVTVACCP